MMWFIFQIYTFRLTVNFNKFSTQVFSLYKISNFGENVNSIADVSKMCWGCKCSAVFLL